MKVTDKQFFIEKFLVEKLDLMCERVVKHKFDNLLIVDGSEGFGKSNLAAALSYYLAWKTNRAFSINNVFFLIDDMIDFAIHNKEQVVWWDEAALGGLASESYNKIQTKLLKLLMIARKKQHFYIFVIPKYFKLREGIIDRAIALLHVYSRDEITRGRFAYYRKQSKEKMYDYWRITKNNGYKRFPDYLGSFSKVLPLVIDEDEYEKRKDAAILSLGEKESPESKQIAKIRGELQRIKYFYATIPDKTQKELAKHAGIGTTTLKSWKNKQISVLNDSGKNLLSRQTIVINGIPTDDGEEDETSIPISKGAGDE